MNETPVAVNTFEEFKYLQAFKNCEIVCEVEPERLCEAEVGFAVRAISNAQNASDYAWIKFTFYQKDDNLGMKVIIDVLTDKLVHDIYEGNGINHPTALGNYLIYGTVTELFAEKMIELYKMVSWHDVGK